MTTALATYQIDADARLGPAMEALSPMMRQFVLALIQTGCSQAKAAELAGYQGGANTWKAMGWRLAHDARVQAAIHEEAQKLIRSTAIMAIGVITGIAKDPKVDAKDRLKAALELLNRSGLSAVTEHKVTVERRMDDAAMIERIKVLATDLGIDHRQLLGQAGVVVDAEFQVVEADDWTIRPGDHHG